MRTSILVSLLLCGAALAACGRRDEAPKAPEAPAAAGAPAEGPAAPPPSARRKPGLWEQSISISGVDYTQTMRLCLDAAADEKLSWWGDQGSKDQCAKNLATQLADGSWRFSSVCDRGSGGTVTTSGVASGDFNSHYEVKAESSTQGAALEQMNATHAMTIVADWRGACPDGMRGGDVEMPGGVRINILDLPK